MEAPLIVITGPTASGKSGLAVDLAEEFGGEIICADSRTIYKGMDIGTAKPSVQDRARVPHWGLDLVKPNKKYTAADFQKYANKKIADIHRRGKIPFLVGGTGLYIDGVILEYQFGPKQPKLRKKLAKLTLEQLQDYGIKNNVKLPENAQNKRYVIRAIEQKSINNKGLLHPQPNIYVVGITTPKEVLHKRIHERSEQLFEAGVVDEAKALGKKYGWNSEAMTGNIYRLVKQYMDGELTEAELRERFEISDRQLAKKQLTWLKRRPFITWKTLPQARTYIAQILAECVQS